ncbi:MAG: DegV family protein [Lachnospiraceae bacterium]|nr:DegV family protein [Lachnospiraceae bacterium]
MRDFIISTETNSDMSKEFLKDNNILVIPHYYTIEDDMYGDGKELTIREFYDEMRVGKNAGTAASNPAVILEKFTEVAKQGKDILHISFSSQLSCGCQNIINGGNDIKEDYPDMTIEVVDTLSASLGEGILLQMAVNMKKEGRTLTEVAKKLREVVPHLNVLVTVDDLDTLYRGGRLSRTSALVGGMIGIKPVIAVDAEGKLVATGKARGRKKALNMLLDIMEQNMGSYKENQEFIGIIHGDCEEDANILKDMIEDKFGFDKFVIEPIGPSIGAHTGPGAIGLVFLGETR